MLKEYPVKGETIIFVEDKEFVKRCKSYGFGWKSKYIGGYCFPKTKKIYIKISRMHDKVLLAHERGHLCGFPHTKFPTIMFPSWIGRIFHTYYPFKRK